MVCEFLKDSNNRIVKVINTGNNKVCTINWAENSEIDIDYVNTALTILFTTRRPGGEDNEEN